MSLFRLALEGEGLFMSLEELLDRNYSDEEWVGFDLDGTTAEYDGWKGPEHIGAPIAKTIEMIKAFLEKGVKVKIFTARVATDDPDELDLAVRTIQAWCLEHIGRVLEITCVKDRHAVRIYDDRGRQIRENEGGVVM